MKMTKKGERTFYARIHENGIEQRPVNYRDTAQLI